MEPVAWRPAQGEKPSGHKKRAGRAGLRGKRGRRTSDPVGWVDLMHLVDCTNEVVSVKKPPLSLDYAMTDGLDTPACPREKKVRQARKRRMRSRKTE